MKIISYNVNGIRAAARKGLWEWAAAAAPDVLCIQETKAQPDQIDLEIPTKLGYHSYFHSAEKRGYSGVAIFSKTKPDHVEIGTAMDYIDLEGRVLRADFGELSVISVYFPSGSSGDVRQEVKFRFLNDFQNYINELKKKRPKLVICGDYNICHRAIDIHDPVRNKNSSGFLPEEREWMSQFIDSGFVDSFRHFHPELADQYSWWSYRANARTSNKGWRIDYAMVTENLRENLERAVILPQAKHSDHCPVGVEVSF